MTPPSDPSAQEMEILRQIEKRTRKRVGELIIAGQADNIDLVNRLNQEQAVDLAITLSIARKHGRQIGTN